MNLRTDSGLKLDEGIHFLYNKIVETTNDNLNRGISMKEYKLVYLNKGMRFSREKDLAVAQEVINEQVAEGWELQQIVSPSDDIGALVGVFFKEKQEDNFY